eukprot:2361910-Pleurochrysis_carterae.AAC.4
MTLQWAPSVRVETGARRDCVPDAGAHGKQQRENITLRFTALSRARARLLGSIVLPRSKLLRHFREEHHLRSTRSKRRMQPWHGATSCSASRHLHASARRSRSLLAITLSNRSRPSSIG